LPDALGIMVIGAMVRLGDEAQYANHRYRNFAECPLLMPVPGASPALFGNTGLAAGAGLTLAGVATNRPSCLWLHRIPRGLAVLDNLPEGCQTDFGGQWWQRPAQRLPFAVGGTVGNGRLLVLADHSLFINDMMLQHDTDNIDFTYNCLDWLRGDQ